MQAKPCNKVLCTSSDYLMRDKYNDFNSCS